MQIKDFYVIPETEEETIFIDKNIEFFLDLSIRQTEYLSLTKYNELVIGRFNNWKEGKIETGKF